MAEPATVVDTSDNETKQDETVESVEATDTVDNADGVETNQTAGVVQNSADNSPDAPEPASKDDGASIV